MKITAVPAQVGSSPAFSLSCRKKKLLFLGAWKKIGDPGDEATTQAYLYGPSKRQSHLDPKTQEFISGDSLHVKSSIYVYSQLVFPPKVREDNQRRIYFNNSLCLE